MACDCITKFNERLAQNNTRLQTQFSTNRDDLSNMICTPYIGTEKIDTKQRKSPIGVVPTFCPFCGVKYREALEGPTNG